MSPRASGGDLLSGRGGSDEADAFQDNIEGSSENDIPNDFSSSTLFFHAILRTIAAVGRHNISMLLLQTIRAT